MKVKDLIEHLQQMDPDAVVLRVSDKLDDGYNITYADILYPYGRDVCLNAVSSYLSCGPHRGATEYDENVTKAVII